MHKFGLSVHRFLIFDNTNFYKILILSEKLKALYSISVRNTQQRTEFWG